MTDRRPAGAVADRVRRNFLLDQRISYRYNVPVTDLIQRLKVVPPEAHGAQLRRRWSITVGGVTSWTTRSYRDTFGNLTVEVAVPRVDDAVEFRIDVEAQTDRVRPPHVTPVDRRYLDHTLLTTPDDAIGDLARGPHGADMGALCAAVHRSLTYEWGVTGVSTTASEALAGGRGVCQDYAHIMLSACRTAGVAARYVSGHLAGEGGSHAWVEVLLPHPARGDTWVVDGWDPTHDRRTDGDYLVVAVGRDYADAAPMSGTYEGHGATNTLAVAKRLDVA